MSLKAFVNEGLQEFIGCLCPVNLIPNVLKGFFMKACRNSLACLFPLSLIPNVLKGVFNACLQELQYLVCLRPLSRS